MTRRPEFYIVGAPKCGTSAMYQYLRQHPQLYLPARKELRYFGADLDVRDRVPLSEAEYLDHFGDAPAVAQVGTAYVWYLYSRLAAREIAAFTPRAKAIAMIRNPIDMLPALHAEHLSNGNEDISDFESALAAEPDRMAGRRIPAHAHLPQGLYYSQVPRYAEQLQRYFDVFGRERVHVIIFDDFARAPAHVYREVLRFLAVDADFQPSAFEVVNPSKRLRSEWLRHFLARPPNGLRRMIRHAVPPRLRRAAYDRAKRFNLVTQPRKPLSTDTRQLIAEMFESQVLDLSRLLDRDLKHWIQA